MVLQCNLLLLKVMQNSSSTSLHSGWGKIFLDENNPVQKGCCLLHSSNSMLKDHRKEKDLQAIQIPTCQKLSGLWTSLQQERLYRKKFIRIFTTKTLSKRWCSCECSLCQNPFARLQSKQKSAQHRKFYEKLCSNMR